MKTKTKTKLKFTSVNYIPEHVLATYGLQTKKLHPLIKLLDFRGFDLEELSSFLNLRSLVFLVCGVNPSSLLTFNEIEDFLLVVQKEFYLFHIDGYVNQRNMEMNKIFNIFRSLYPQYKDIFRAHEIKNVDCELEHFHNLIILVLLFELELYQNHYTEIKGRLESCDRTEIKEKLDLIQIKKGELIKTLSGGIRISISRNRLILQDRVYAGFDTEYTNIDGQNNRILCYTTASTSESILRIRSNKIDFSLREGNVKLPKTADLITTGVKLIRLLRGKKDFELCILKESLDRESTFDRLTLFNQDVIYKQKAFDISKIHTSFHDIRTDPSQYSFYGLIDVVLKNQSDSIPNKYTQTFSNFTRKLNLKPIFRSECFLIAHFTTADVSLFSDFNDVKDKLSILNKSFLTLDRNISYKKWKVYLRDSSLLSPGGMSLKAIGNLYPTLSLSKVELDKKQIKAMDQLFDSNKPLFMDYAIQDAKIVLWHSLQVLNSHYQLSKKYTIPVTLSSLASSFLSLKLVASEDIESRYHPKTKNGLISVKDLAKLNTPIGIELSGDLHEYIDYFLGSYHGGRNESYFYGMIDGRFHDYDLPGAYPTAMAMLDYPDWSKKILIGKTTGEDFYQLYQGNLIKSYTGLKVKFRFPDSVQYPNLPVRLDFSSVIFPLEGETFCTGVEFYLAMRLNCQIEILGGVFIPFKERTLKNTKNSIVVDKKDIPNNKDILENMEKEIFVRDPFFEGVKNEIKRTLITEIWEGFDDTKQIQVQTEHQSQTENQIVSIDSTDIVCESETENESNFYLVVKELMTERLKYPKGSYMNLLYKFLANAGIGQMARGLNQKVKYDSKTNSTRVLPSGDLVSPLYAGWITSFIRTTLSELMNIHRDSKIVSCTTDGFISSKENLEKIEPDPKDIFSSFYFNMRRKLTGKGELLEVKHNEPKGVISWRTRGQLGLSGGIKALTGYQRNEEIEQTIKKVDVAMKTTKVIPFIQKSLRSAKEIFLKGGHSTQVLNERNFNLKFDNRREVTIEHETYSETKPFISCTSSKQARLISSFGSGRFRIYSPISSTQCRGDAYLFLTRRMLVRVIKTEFPFLKRCEVALVMKDLELPCTLNFISKQKDRKPIFNSIPHTQKTLEVLKKFKLKFPGFNIDHFLRM